MSETKNESNSKNDKGYISSLGVGMSAGVMLCKLFTGCQHESEIEACKPKEVYMQDINKDGKQDVVIKSKDSTWTYYNFDGTYLQADSIAKIIQTRANHAADSARNAYMKNITDTLK